ncbi:hypothetical protein HHI36_018070 [Cryptolaemus montrouzieri]|uniref:ZZ-type zinc finger-containing protein 3 n=1 Tax=Cryptolaemus montrouzieri TaxID=559131 RepID=A0ABD2NZV4_9CUCU
MMEDTTDNPQQKEEDLFYFESDHLALKGNKDYSELLKTLFILSAQRERAIKDFEKIQIIKKSAFENPGSFLEKLKNDELDIPPVQVVAQIPFINWYGYNTKIPEDELKAIYSGRSNEKKDFEDLGKGEGKNTHKQPWTPEEQKRLEELLVIYPPEPIELRRIKKIAAALGNRTVQQVSSRLQKYFLKLHKAGLHVPGRIPKSSNFQRKNKQHKHNMWKPTTFFPEYNVSVFMDDTESVPGPSTQDSPNFSNSNTSNYLLPAEYHQSNIEIQSVGKSDTELQLQLLKRIRAEKIKEAEMSEPYTHATFRCDYCNEEPIVGTRWHCSSCADESVDFCTDCLLSQLYSENPHPLSHTFITLPHSDDPNFNMSSDSESGSANETSNNNDISDSDVSAPSNFSLEKSTPFSSPNSMEKSSKNGLKKSPDGPTVNNFEVDKFLNELMYAEEKETNTYSTQDIGYSYLHTNLSLGD